MKMTCTVVLMLGVALVAGCKKKPMAEHEAPKETPISKLPPVNSKAEKERRARIGADDSPSAAMDVRRGMDREKIQNYLTQIGVFYNDYNTTFGRSPKTLEEFENYIKRDAHGEVEALKDGFLTLKLNTPLSSNAVLAYETEPYRDMRHVLFGDGHVKMMNTQDFQAALKGQ
jgi:prepilin-type processing-associated H-X9-DG protein